MTAPDLTLLPPLIDDPKGVTTVSVVGTHAIVRSSVRSSHRRTMLMRLSGALSSMRGRFRAARAARAAARAAGRVRVDWTVVEMEELRGVEREALPPASERHPAPGPESPLGASGSHRVQVPPPGPQQQSEPPLAYLPPPPQDVLRAVGLDVMDMLGRDLTSRQAFDRLQRHMSELQKRYRQVENLERRSVSNVSETQMDASLLVAADRRGESQEELAERAERVKSDMVARARRASDPRPTSQFQAITEDMPDPRTAARPVDVLSGDVEVVRSPVHGAASSLVPPVPVQRRPEAAPLPRRGFVGGVEPVVPDGAWSGGVEDTHVSAVVDADADGVDVEVAS